MMDWEPGSQWKPDSEPEVPWWVMVSFIVLALLVALGVANVAGWL